MIRFTLAGKTGKRGAVAASVVLAAALVFVLNAVFLLLAQRFPALSIDLTRGKLFKLSERTIEYIKSLDKDVVINVLAREETFAGTSPYNAQANEVFKQFEKNGPRISLVYVDYMRNPGFAAAYPGLVMKHGDLLVSAGENAGADGRKRSLIKTEELFNYARGQRGELSIVSSRAEEALYTAILNVSSDKPVRAAFITGHAEYTMDAFTAVLTKNNYETVSWNLMRGRAPDTDIAFIIAPKEDFTAEELGFLDEFLFNGGAYGRTLFYCADPAQSPLERLAVFLREWGVSVEDGAVFETDETRVYNYQPFYAVADYAEEEEFAPALTDISKPFLAPVSRPLRLLFEYRNNYSARPLLEFGASAGVRPSNAPETFTADDAVRRGPFPALALCRYSVIDQATGRAEKVSNVLVSGSTAMLDALAVDNPAFSNTEYLVNVLNRLSGREDIPLRPKSFTGMGLNLPRLSVNILGMVFIFLLPAVILAAGLVVWIKRRHA